MSGPRPIPELAVEAVLLLLLPIVLPLVHQDRDQARQLGLLLLASHEPRSAEELRLAAEIVGFGLQAAQTLAKASDPDLSQPDILRLHATALGLARGEASAQRRLDAARKAWPAETEVAPDLDLDPAAPAVQPQAASVPASQPDRSPPGTPPGTPPGMTARTAHNPTHARQLAREARKAAMVRQMTESHLRRRAAFEQQLGTAEAMDPATDQPAAGLVTHMAPSAMPPGLAAV